MAAGTGLAGLGEALESAILPAVRAHGLTIVDLDVRGGGRRAVVRIFVDKPGGVTIDDCRRLSDEVGDLIDVSGLIAESYDLEVSSPGLDRELRKEREFRWATGKLVHLWIREPLEGRRELVGRLESVEPAAFTLRDAEQSRRVPRDLVTKARLEVEPRGSA